MKFDAGYVGPHTGVAPAAQAAHQAGLSALWLTETGYDPFIATLLASQAEPELELGTAIAVAFARSPMTMAQTAWDLAALTKGKFWLGLGSQIKPHITRRFSMPWGKPAEQMRDFIGALRAIWKSFETGEKLAFASEHYNHSLLTPFFSPAPHEFSKIPIGLAAVGPKMTELAGEAADFVVAHTFTTPAYLRAVTLPSLEAGLAKAGRDRKSLTVVGSVFVITGDEEGKRTTEAQVRKTISFYGSTPAYAPVLESIGHGDLSAKLHALSRKGEWEEIARIIPAEVLAALSVKADPPELRAAIEERFGDVYDRVQVSLTPEQLKWITA